MNGNLNKKTISISNDTASFRPFAWLALSILAVGAFGNSVQAQTVWLNDTLSGYTTDNVPLTTAASPQLIATPGSSWTVLGAGSPKKLRTYKPAGAATPFTSTANSSASRLNYKLSTDSGNAIDRGPVGYLSYKVTPNANAAFINLFDANKANSSWLEVGLGTTGTVGQPDLFVCEALLQSLFGKSSILCGFLHEQRRSHSKPILNFKNSPYFGCEYDKNLVQ